MDDPRNTMHESTHVFHKLQECLWCPCQHDGLACVAILHKCVLLSRVLKDERLRSGEDILVKLRLMRLCPLSRCHIPNSFTDALAPLRLMAPSDSCPRQSGGRRPRRGAGTCPVRQGQSLIPDLCWNCRRDE